MDDDIGNLSSIDQQDTRGGGMFWANATQHRVSKFWSFQHEQITEMWNEVQKSGST